MSRRIRLVSLVLALVTVLSAVCSLSVAADATLYDNAGQGDLLYAADFNGTQDFWTPGYDKVESDEHKWSRLDYTVDSADSGKVTFSKTEAGNAAWGADLTQLPLGSGFSYTVLFTVTRTADNPIGLLIDGHYGAVVYATKARLRRNGSGLSGKSDVTFSNLPGTAPSTSNPSVQNFALEVNGTDATFSLWVKNSDSVWVKLDTGSPTEGAFNMDWSSSDEYQTLGLFFYSYWVTEVTVSNLNVYKGTGLLSGGYFVKYEDLKDGEKILDLNFSANGEWQPTFSTATNYTGLTADVSAGGDSVIFTASNSGGNRGKWGAAFAPTLPLSAGANYTFYYHLALSGDTAYFGVFPDGNQGIVVKGDGTARLLNGGTVKGERWVSVTDRTDVSGRERDYAVELNAEAKTLELFVKSQNGHYGSVLKVNVEELNTTWKSDVLNAVLYTAGRWKGNGGETATVSNFSVYKGLTESSFDPSSSTQSDIKTLVGAAVLLDSETTVRFTGQIGKTLLSALKSEYGDNNVKVGLLLTPTENLAKVSAFTKAALDACTSITGTKYLKVDAKDLLESEDGFSYYFYGSWTMVTDASYERKISAITYAEVNGETYFYSDYVEKNHSRSVFEVSEKALADLESQQMGEYQYEFRSKFSPYSKTERNYLYDFSGANLFTAMSYNIRYAEKYDSVSDIFSGNYGKVDWEGRDPAKVVKTITANSPDMVGLQEVTSPWDDYLSALTSTGGYTRIKGGTGSENNRVEVYYKTDRFNCLDSGVVYYVEAAKQSWAPENTEKADVTKNDNGGKGRMFVWVLLENKLTGQKILFISTHIHYGGGTSSAYAAEELIRRYEIKLLLEWIKTQAPASDCQIVTGDMNSHYKSGEGKKNIEVFKNGGFQSACEAAEQKGDVGGTLAGSGKTVRQEWIFDYVLSKGSVKTKYYTVVDNKIDKSNTAYPSDHLPVMATYKCLA